MAEKAFVRVTGRRWLSGQSLHLGQEYLLCVNSGMFQETYRRFYYRDIQAIIIRRSSDSNMAIFLSLVLLAISLIVVFAADETAVSWIFGSIGALAMLSLVRIGLGQGACACYIQTPVSIQRLPITDYRRAKRLLAALEPRVAAVQGDASNQTLRRLLAESQEMALAAQAKPTVVTAEQGPIPVEGDGPGDAPSIEAQVQPQAEPAQRTAVQELAEQLRAASDVPRPAGEPPQAQEPTSPAQAS